MIEKKLVADTEEELNELVGDYYKSFPPRGYCTAISISPHKVVEANSSWNGKWLAVVKRSESCG